jgi:ankyrin repeat protein
MPKPDIHGSNIYYKNINFSTKNHTTSININFTFYRIFRSKVSQAKTVCHE